MKTVAIVQSNYIPWKGYFDLIASADEFILYDDVQYTQGDWRNRNRIKTPQGLHWLTVPVKVTGRRGQLIREAEIEGPYWAKDHWQTLAHNYRRAPFFAEIEPELRAFYLDGQYCRLSDLNRTLIAWAMRKIGITTLLSSSSDYQLDGDRTMRLVNLCLQAGAEEYISGPAARSYLDERLFERKGIKVRWFDYGNYGVYPQLWGEFEHGVSVLDLLFNTGPSAYLYLKSGARCRPAATPAPQRPGGDHA
ncbi:MAG: hypothetical protein GAK35_04125 [Herbaspirillum frisingense]|uniref:WbqC family protein n=1 Tax=Herbaspirillum frisingense TaxID=92645 RepID=A0A7V8FSY9_9BURK|nr:MAG: hypothetical protein GAK35_04125 [Herbaspirillum frisingense]